MAFDLEYKVGDTLPPIDLGLKRNGSAVDITNAVGASVYLRQEGGSVVISGSAAKLGDPTLGFFRFLIGQAALGSAGFSTPGGYLGQISISWASGKETNKYEFTLDVKPSYRTA